VSIFLLITIVIVLLVPSQTILFFWPPWSLVLGRHIDYLSPSISIVDCIIILLITSYIFIHWIYFFQIIKKWYFEVFNFPDSIKSTFSILVFIFIITNIAVSEVPQVALYHWARLTMYCGFMCVLYHLHISKKHITIVLSLAFFWSALLAMLQFIFQSSIGGMFYFFGERTFITSTPGIARGLWCLPFNYCTQLLRPYATFPHPNVLAGFGLLSTVLVFLEYASNPQKYSHLLYKIYGSINLLLLLCVLLFTQSRGAIFAMFSVCIIGSLIVVNRYKKNPIIKTGVYIISIISIVFVISSIVFIIQRGISTADESITDRISLAQSSIKMFIQSPFVGVGLFNFLPNLPSISIIRTPTSIQPVHNIFLLLVSEIGIVGCMLLFFSIFFHSSFRKNLLSNILICSVITILGMVDHYLFTVRQGQLLLLLSLYCVIDFSKKNHLGVK
jgi:hypothetical protein